MALYAIRFERKIRSHEGGWDRYEFAKTRRGAMSAVRRLVRSQGGGGGVVVARYCQRGIQTTPERYDVPPGTWIVRLEWPCMEAATPGYQRADQWARASDGAIVTRMRWLESDGPRHGIRKLDWTVRVD